MFDQLSTENTVRTWQPLTAGRSRRTRGFVLLSTSLIVALSAALWLAHYHRALRSDGLLKFAALPYQVEHALWQQCQASIVGRDVTTLPLLDSTAALTETRWAFASAVSNGSYQAQCLIEVGSSITTVPPSTYLRAHLRLMAVPSAKQSILWQREWWWRADSIVAQSNRRLW